MAITLDGTTGITSPGGDVSVSQSLSGNLTFTGTGNRITGDFSNATVANRVAFQTSTTNSNTGVGILPNGTATASFFLAYNNSDPTNAGFAALTSTTVDNRLTSGISGTGSYLPLTMLTGGSERMRIDTSGNVGIGTSSPTQKLDVNGNAILTGNGRSLQICNAGAGYIYFRDTSTGSEISHNANALQLITSQTNGITFSTSGANERARITSDGALALTGFPSNGNGVRIYCQGNQSVASGGTVSIIPTNAGAVLVLVWNNSEGTGLMCFGSYDQTMEKIAGTGAATDTGSAHAIYKSASSNTITYKNKYGGTRNVWIAVYAALAN